MSGPALTAGDGPGRPVRLAYGEAPTAVVAACAGVPRPVVLVDGGSGAGKTSLAALVAEAWEHPRPLRTVSLDELYPGWSGLAAASEQLPRLLGPQPGYRRWDWARCAPAGWVPVDPEQALLVEGCGALTRESSPLATLRVWVELDAEARKARALARDQGGFDPYWQVWADQEHDHWRRNQPWQLADLTVIV